MAVYMLDRQILNESLLGLFASLCVLMFAIFICIGKKKQKTRTFSKISDDLEIGDIAVPVVIKDIQVAEKIEDEANVKAENEDQVSTAVSDETRVTSNENDTENQLIAQYDPTTSQSHSTIDPYETIDKEAIKKNVQVTNIANENSTSGSGNSDSGNSIYTKVKKVEKEEEIAYAVVDIKESQEKYEVVNGDIVRRLTQPHIEKNLVDANDANKDSSEDDGDKDEEKLKLDEGEDSGGSDPYASVKPCDVGVGEGGQHQEGVPSSPRSPRGSLPESPRRSLPESPRRSLPESPRRSLPGSPRSLPGSPRSLLESPKPSEIVDAYAVVVKAERAVVPKEEIEDSGASGFYAEVSSNETNTQPPQPRVDDAYAVVVKAKPAVVPKEELEDSGASGFYAQVISNTVTTQPPPQRKDDAYAVVVKAAPAVFKTEQEDSGGSGFYAQVNSNSVTTQLEQQPPPLPPPHAPHLPHPPLSNSTNIEKFNDDGSYEPISKDDGFNMYDSISEVKNIPSKSKTKADKKDHSDSKKHKYDSKYKHKSHKKQDSTGDGTSITAKSPKQSRFSRVNPFKSSKKIKQKQLSDNLNTDQTKAEKEHEENDEIKDKTTSLPTSARKSPRDLTHDDLTKRHSSPSPNIPPPLPSYDKLKHLTGHQNKRRGSSFDACSSPDSSPRSSPRTPLDHLMMHYPPPNMSARSVTTTTNESSRDSNTVFSDLDNYSMINPSSVEPSFDENEDMEDEKYSTVDNNLKKNILSHDKSDTIEEDDKYTTVKDAIESDDKSKDSNETKIEKPYDTVKDLEKPVNKTVDASLTNDGAGYGNEVEEPDYAVVDLASKRLERERLKSINSDILPLDQASTTITNDDYEPITTTTQTAIPQPVATTQAESSTTIAATLFTETAEPETTTVLEIKTTTTTTIFVEDDSTKRFSTNSDYMYIE